MAEKSLSLRLTQTIVPFGVGAIYSANYQSFVAMDTKCWGDDSDPIELLRLSQTLGVDGFRSPKSDSDFPFQGQESDDEGLPYYRFPRWLFCQECRRLTYFSKHEEQGIIPKCADCKKNYTPMRFIAVCEDGHMQDVQWHDWAHNVRSGNAHELKCEFDPDKRTLIFETKKNAGGSLAASFIECQISECKANKSLEGITRPKALLTTSGRPQRCNGRQPWEDRTTHCEQELRAVHHGAGNVYFASVPKAIDIPPASDHDSYKILYEKVANDDAFSFLYQEIIRDSTARSLAAKYETDVETIIKIWEQARKEFDGINASQVSTSGRTLSTPAPHDILFGEWEAFRSSRTKYDDDDNFNISSVDIGEADTGSVVDKQTSDLLDRVVQGKRLRIVKALAGFTRLKSNEEQQKLTRPDLTKITDEPVKPWLPAIQIFGEGIFISFKESQLKEWEKKREVQAVAERVNSILANSSFGANPTSADPRTIMLHTLSHIIIRRVAFSAGYSLSSIEERLYARPTTSNKPSMAGILFYTAAGDTEGSLGGLVKLAEPFQLFRIIQSALIDAMWCSQDPICSEISSGYESVNRAACHACCFLPETSCESNNILLDRRLLIGPQGFFKQLGDLAM